MEPKLPIINVLTAPTSAQNRGGSRMKDDETARGMEFFDPKTRPAAIFWDEDALLTAPASLVRADGGAASTARAAMNLGGTAINPLVEGDRLQAYRLCARRAAAARRGRPTPRRATSCAPRRSAEPGSRRRRRACRAAVGGARRLRAVHGAHRASART